MISASLATNVLKIRPRFCSFRKFATKPEALPTDVDAVVIGGGSIGCSTLYHLTKFGLTNVVLLERNKITSGTTWHTAGLLWRLRPSDVDVELIAHTRALNETILEQETGQSTGWIRNGGLFIASTQERLKEYKRLMTLGRCYGIESHVLSPEESKKLYPLLNVEDLCGTLYSPGDGLIDPSGYCNALIKAAQMKGARLIENCAVLGIDTKIDDFGVRRVVGVRTKTGKIKSPVVINCAGAWGRKVGRMAGVDVPLLAMKHAYVITEKIEGVRNMPNVRDHDASIYLRLQGDALAVGGYEPNPVFIDGDVADDFAFSLYDLDWDVFAQHIRGATNRVPVLGQVGVKSEVCGPESFTPDHRPLMGETTELRGFYLGCGFNSAGMMLGGGCGRQLAHTVVHGRPELHMHNYDIARFSPSLTNDESWIKQRSHESYVNNYKILWPYDEPLAGRNLRLSPLYEELLNKGCVYQERFGWERPGWFYSDQRTAAAPAPYDYYGAYEHPKNDPDPYAERLKMDYTFDFPKNHHMIAEECKSCRQKAAVFDMSYFGKFYISGPDAQKAVDWIFSNDMRKPTGSTVYTCMLNEKGGVEADLTVSMLDGEGENRFLGSDHLHLTPVADGRTFYVAAGGAIAEHVRRHLKNEIQKKRFDVRLCDVSENLALISVQGPLSARILRPFIHDFNIEDDAAFPFASHRLIKFGDAGRPCRLMRLSFVGELGYEFHAPVQYALEIYREVMKAGSKSIVDAGYRAIDALSLEKGYRLWGTDIRHTDTPLEAGLGFTCKLKTDVDFRGRRAIEKQKTAGLTRRLMCFTLNEDRPLWGLETIYRNDEPVGFLRRADYAFTLHKPIGHGYVSAPDGSVIVNEWLKSGRYEIESMGQRVAATLHLKSPFDPDNARRAVKK